MNTVLRRAVPVVDVQVGAADRRNLDLNQNVGASKRGDLDLSNLRAGCGFCFYDRLHGVRHVPTLTYEFGPKTKTLNSSIPVAGGLKVVGNNANEAFYN